MPAAAAFPEEYRTEWMRIELLALAAANPHVVRSSHDVLEVAYADRESPPESSSA
jgi:hypothetical protein